MNTQNRRILKTRQAPWVQQLTSLLVRTSITPNQISLMSVIASLMSGISFYIFGCTQSLVALVCAALCIQLRLLCNMMDGLVAVEGGKGTKSGELYNDVPDRIADVIIIIGASCAITSVDWAVTLGWVTASLAIGTAYIRTLGASLGAPVSFIGPMAKQHRMALLTAASLITIVESFVRKSHYSLLIALIIMFVGTLYTCYRRLKKIYSYLENK